MDKDAADLSVPEQTPKAEPSELNEPSHSGIAGEERPHDPAIAASTSEEPSEPPAPENATASVAADETPAATNEAPEAAPSEPPSETLPAPAAASAKSPPSAEPSEPPNDRKIPPPPWSSAGPSSRSSLPPPPAAPSPGLPSGAAVRLPARSSVPAVATNVRREHEKISGIPSVPHRQDDARKAIIIGSALTIIFGVLYLGRDKLMGNAPPSSMSAAPTPASASLRITARQEGVMVLFDGKPLGTLPLLLRGVSPGDHSLTFEAGARYAPQKRTVSVAAGEAKELEPVSLVVALGVATFDVTTPGASLALVSDDERRELADYSHPIEVDNGKSWILEASKPGYRTMRIPLAFEDRAEKTFVVALDKASDRSARVTSRAEAAVPTVVDPPDTARPVALKLPHSSQPSGSKSDAPAGSCTLNIDSNPPSNLTLDGRSFGETPKMGISVAAGTHSVMFVSERGKKATIVNCRSGEQKTLAVQLSTH